MEKKRPALQSALIVAGILFVFLLGYLYVAEEGPFDRSNRFFLEVSDARGLKKETPLQYRGITIGKVKDVIELETGSVIVELAVDRGVSITKDAAFSRQTEGVLGKIVLVLEMEGMAGEMVFPGDTLKVEIEQLSLQE
jgi:ABC-type transporter Mla subunit MlaD